DPQKWPVLVASRGTVVGGLKLLDLSGLQNESIQLGACLFPCDLPYRVDEPPNVGFVSFDGCEVAPHSRHEPLGLPDVEHLSPPILHEVDTRPVRKAVEHLIADAVQVGFVCVQCAVRLVLEGEYARQIVDAELEIQVIEQPYQDLCRDLRIWECAMMESITDAVEIAEGGQRFGPKPAKQPASQAQSA